MSMYKERLNWVEIEEGRVFLNSLSLGQRVRFSHGREEFEGTLVLFDDDEHAYVQVDCEELDNPLYLCEVEFLTAIGE